MINSITAVRTRAALAIAAWMFGLGALAQPVPVLPADLPKLPHLAHPDAVPYPDYYALAHAHTVLEDDPAFRSLHLRPAGQQADPAFIVLPVQTQAFGFRPPFRALVGALLDRELARRHVDASLQTDIVDWRGPFVRRTDDATLSAFAADHPHAARLTAYLGQDGNGTAFLTLSRSGESPVRVAHRRLPIAPTAVGTLETISAALPGLLAELGLGDARPARSLPPARPEGCVAAHWNLADLPPTAAPDDVACHAILMGTLMPDYFERMGYRFEPTAPDRLAWLARAWVEATPVASQSTAMHSIAALAAAQLQLDVEGKYEPGEIDSHDVVVRPLARMLDARRRAAHADLGPELAGLPSFAAALMKESAAYTEAFRHTDLCTLELALPHFRTPTGCDDDAGSSPPARTARASLAESQLLETWRLAAGWDDLYVEGVERGSQSRYMAVLAGLPASISAHPVIQEMRFAARDYSGVPRDAAGHRAWASSTIGDYAKAITTLQRDDPLIGTHAAAEAALPGEKAEQDIFRAVDDLDRLAHVIHMDSPGSSAWPPAGNAASKAVFLADGFFGQARLQQSWEVVAAPVGPPASPGTSTTAHPTAELARLASSPARDYPPAIARGMFARDDGTRLPSRQTLQGWLTQNPSKISTRLALALVALEHGDGVASARQIIDSRPRSMRAQDAVGETIDLAGAGSIFYFAGDLATAREYYVRAAALETGSVADMAARTRIALIDGDIVQARQEVHRRVQRYDDDYGVGQEAGLLFMAGRAGQAWPLILSRAATSKGPDLWRVALSGHRIQGDALTTLPDWVRQAGLERVSDIASGLAANSWIQVYATLDRSPALPDADTRKAMYRSDPSQTWAQGILTRRAAIDGTPVADLTALERDATQMWFNNQGLLPFYTWALWNTTGGKSAQLDLVREASIESGFAGTLSKAMVLAADGKRDEALRFLGATRYELGRLALFGTPYAVNDPLGALPYDFVLASWLMTRKTGEPAYVAQGLAIAKAYQHVEAWVAWPYAAEALLSSDPKVREVAACRAQKLDADSMFLHESGLHPDPNSATCREATAW